MDIITVNVGQGSLTIVRHNGEAIISDSRIPPSGDDSVAYVKGVLAEYLKGYYVRGLILTGFDRDHSDAIGVELILVKYLPDWIMYPKYYKDTDEASDVFEIIRREQKKRKDSDRPLRNISVCLDDIGSRSLNNLSLSNIFEFELFSPHTEDMDSSNNSSIVLRLVGKGSGGYSYLITGDTEKDRWEKINQFFGDSLQSEVMAAPHHGSKNSVHIESLLNIDPNTILISAGVDNQYGHPDTEAVEVYGLIAKHVFSTNISNGVSLHTQKVEDDFDTICFR